MAIYDPESKKLVVRIVYDGPGMAGKTTNLQQLCAQFARERRSELYRGATAAERTLCLDWMQFDGGRVQGQDLRCHLLTVPGQPELGRRRERILELADATVFVLESTEAGLSEAWPMWQSLLARTGGAREGACLVLQANKQDRPEALSPGQIRERWGLSPGVPVVPATASTGAGVRETAVLAARSAAVHLQESLSLRTLAELEGSYEAGPELERRILELEGDSTADRPPPLPSPNVPAGLVWPALEGRRTLRRVPFMDAEPRPSGALEGRAPGGTEGIVYEAGIWCLRTAPERRFGSAERARRALLELARLKLGLGTFCAPRTALVVQKDHQNGHWLWTISVWLTTIETFLRYARDAGDEGGLSEALSQFARAVLRALRLCLDAQLVLELEPACFGLLHDEPFYVAEGAAAGGAAPRAGEAMLRRFDEYERFPGALRVYEELLLEGLETRFRGAELDRLGLARGLQVTRALTPTGERARTRLERHVRGWSGG